MSLPNSLGLGFHHFGLGVRRAKDAMAYLAALGYRIGDEMYDPNQNVHLRMCDHPSQPGVEIISPGKGPGPLDGILKAHEAGLVYHLCYTTASAAAALEKLEEAGLRVTEVSPQKPAPLFGGQPVSFHWVVGVGVIELLETAPAS